MFILHAELFSYIFVFIYSFFFPFLSFGLFPSLVTGLGCDCVCRFFPKLRMGHIFVFLEIKVVISFLSPIWVLFEYFRADSTDPFCSLQPGFDAYVSDFHIPKNMECHPGDRIVSVQTASCVFNLFNLHKCSCMIAFY